MNQDDLPPRTHQPDEDAADAFGQLMGAMLWIGPFVAAGAVILYALSRWT